MNECCGKQVTTAYCPDCGKEQEGAGDPLWQLLRHIRKQLRIKRARQRRISEKRTEPYRGEAKSLIRLIVQWESWESAIVEAVKKSNEPKKPREPNIPEEEP